MEPLNNRYGSSLFVASVVAAAVLRAVNTATATVLRVVKKAAEKSAATATKKIRVASVLPSATEILCSIGGEHLLVGRSHEDNFPSSITHLPALTDQLISREWTSASAVNAEVSSALASGKSLYFLNAKLLAELKPDLILTQDLCSVCAVDLAEFKVISFQMDPQPILLSFDPQNLEDVLADMIILGEAVGMQKEAAAAKSIFDNRVTTVVSTANEILKEQEGKGRIKVAFIEWSDPIYVAGHWIPQLVYMAGGEHTLNPCRQGEQNSQQRTGGAGKSFPVTNENFVASDPDLIILSPCGLNLEMSRREADRLMSLQWFQDLRAVKNKRLLVVDGDAMFNRPGPRLVDALEWLVSVLHDAGDGKHSKSVTHAMSLQPQDFPFFDYFEKVSAVDLEIVVAEIKTSEDLALVAIEEAHTAAFVKDADSATEYKVVSEFGLYKRSQCCGYSCLRCPFGHYNVEKRYRKANVIRHMVRPTMLWSVTKRVKRGTKKPLKETVLTTTDRAQGRGEKGEIVVDVLFWSGGKDSYLSLLLLEQQHLASKSNDFSFVEEESDEESEKKSGKKNKKKSERKSERRVVLLTTFEGSSPTGEITHQGLQCRDIMDQAKALGLDLLLVPLPNKDGDEGSKVNYKDTVLAALEILKMELAISTMRTISEPDIKLRLVFGDLHLKDIRDWRESTFGGEGEGGLQCYFPAFEVDYAELMGILWAAIGSEVRDITISAWTGLYNDESTAMLVSKGAIYDEKFVASLPPSIDKMGEKGEFHTHVKFLARRRR